MSPKNLQLLQALMYLAFAIVMPLVVIGPSGLGSAALLGGIFLTLACYHWFKFKKTPADAVPYNVTKLPPDEQIRVLRWMIWIVVILGPIVSYWTYQDFASVEAGSGGSVSFWTPEGLLYNTLGFWPAVLFWPLIFLVTIGACFRQMEKAKEMSLAASGIG